MGLSKKQIKSFTLGFWLLLIALIIGAIIYNPKFIEADYLVAYIQQYQNQMLIIYTVLSIVRGFFLIPSTPFVIAGGLLFPDQLLLVLIISMLGIMVAALGLYYFADWLGFGNYLEDKFPQQIPKWKKRLQHKNALYFVIGWAFFPFVPTDLMCYVAGLVKMPLKYFLTGIFIGELVLVTCYVYFGKGLFELLA